MSFNLHLFILLKYLQNPFIYGIWEVKNATKVVEPIQYVAFFG